MATFTFVLKNSLKAEAKTLIYLVIRENGKRLKFSTGEKVHPSQWDAKNVCVQPAPGKKRLTESEKATNIQLARYVEEAEKIISAAKIEGEPVDLNQARAILEGEFTTRPKAQPLTFVSYSRDLSKSLNRRPQTKKAYEATISTVEAYENEKRKGKPLKFEDITLDFYNAFVAYCEGVGYAKNTIGTRIKNIKVFMDNAYEAGLHNNLDYKRKGFKKLKEEVNHVYLTEKELSAIAAKKLPLNSKLDKVRDLFLVACRTGLRFSDLRNLTADKIVETETGQLIQIRSEKTESTVYIPLHEQTREILVKKHKYNLPRVPSNQKFNDYLKELAQVAEVDNLVTLNQTKGGQKTESIVPKYKLVTVHTARRTFATLAYKAGLPAQSIMKITGHKSEKTFQTYLKLDAREHAQLMAKHDFFKPNLKVVG